jgi:hypothetical protein
MEEDLYEDDEGDENYEEMHEEEAINGAKLAALEAR